MNAARAVAFAGAPLAMVADAVGPCRPGAALAPRVGTPGGAAGYDTTCWRISADSSSISNGLGR
jgi:hypothetical protein